jgi:hypothetical protein
VHSARWSRAIPEEELSQYEVVRSYARGWAEGIRRHAKRYREAYGRAHALDHAWEHGDTELMEWDDVVVATEAAWVEAHLLVVAAHQMESWHQRLVAERGNAPRAGECDA